MRKTDIRPSHAGAGILACALACSLAVGVAGCETSSSAGAASDSAEATTDEASASALGAPTDLEIDFSTGDFTFQSTDEGVGYYFLRAYNEGGIEAGEEYVATSSRVNGGSVGELSGSIDLESLGWGTYEFSLVGFASAGSDAEAPEAQVSTYRLGIGGTMERPEMMVLADGDTAEFYIDLYTLSDWYAYQLMPEVRFDVYSDSGLTELVRSETVDLSDLAPQEESVFSSGTTWNADAEALHLYLQPSSEGSGPMMGSSEPTGLVSQLVLEDLAAGTYYVTATALGDESMQVSDSQASEAVEFTVTDADATGEFTATRTSLWADPVLGGMGVTAEEGTYADRVDFALSQSTTGELVS